MTRWSPKQESNRLPTAADRMRAECIIAVPRATAKVEHLPRFVNQRYGHPKVLCGNPSAFWSRRVDVKGELAVCAGCTRQAEREGTGR